MTGFPTLKGSYSILSCITHRPAYMPNFIEIEETFCGQTNVGMHVRMDGHLRLALLG